MLLESVLETINYAQSIGDEVLAMHISTKETEEKDQEILQEFADYSKYYS